MHIPDNIRSAVRFVLGDADRISDRPEPPFHPLRIAFLADLSRLLMGDPRTKAFPDVAAFAFWCRRGSIQPLADRSGHQGLRIGLGAIFHITPSNVPINFAYSLVFSFLSGNTSIVRLPSADNPQTALVLDALARTLEIEQYGALRAAIHAIRHERDDAITEFWLQNTLGRIIWGGDATIAHVRTLKSHPRSREIAFADRYSLSAIDAHSVIEADLATLAALRTGLFNDIYLMDQNACSSPQLFVWVGSPGDIEAAQAILWPALAEEARARYAMKPIHATDKFVELCREVIEFPNIAHVEFDGPVLTRIALNALSPAQCFQRGHFGTIHEFPAANLDAIVPIVDARFQTLTYFGFPQDALREFVRTGQLSGIDRIVPIGQALNMGFYWDGFDIISTLTRLVDIQ